MKQTPPETPYYFYRLARAAYREEFDAQTYLNEPDHLPDRIAVLDQEIIKSKWFILLVPITSTWKVTLFSDKETGMLIVGFEGTHQFENWADNLANLINDQKFLLKPMKKILDRWVEDYHQEISVFVGHSAGGYFATHCHKSWDVFRITFNSFKSERGEKNINLALNDDPLHQYEIAGGVEGRYDRIGDGGHALRDFLTHMPVDASWEDIMPGRFYDEAATTSTSEATTSTATTHPVDDSPTFST